jgi:hypothetical protein
VKLCVAGSTSRTQCTIRGPPSSPRSHRTFCDTMSRQSNADANEDSNDTIKKCLCVDKDGMIMARTEVEAKSEI